jgi:hypothetical protein
MPLPRFLLYPSQLSAKVFVTLDVRQSARLRVLNALAAQASLLVQGTSLCKPDPSFRHV